MLPTPRHSSHKYELCSLNGEISLSLHWMARYYICSRIQLAVLTDQLFRYREKPIQQKLEILYQRDLFVLAINLAQKANLDTMQRNIILRKYGDYLYQKGDFDTAMQQFLKAIDNTEPSQVIRKV